MLYGKYVPAFGVSFVQGHMNALDDALGEEAGLAEGSSTW